MFFPVLAHLLQLLVIEMADCTCKYSKEGVNSGDGEKLSCSVGVSVSEVHK